MALPDLAYDLLEIARILILNFPFYAPTVLISTAGLPPDKVKRRLAIATLKSLLSRQLSIPVLIKITKSFKESVRQQTIKRKKFVFEDTHQLLMNFTASATATIFSK